MKDNSIIGTILYGDIKDRGKIIKAIERIQKDCVKIIHFHP
ncbi:MAG: hypothetical protein AB1488_02215 [Nitrospirota bacterium]